MYLVNDSSPALLPDIAVCQHACFPDSFGTKLGYAYTTKSLAWFLAGKNRFLFYIESSGKVVGYCGGFIPLANGDGSTSGIMRFAMKEAFAGMLKKPWLFFSSEIVPFYPLIVKNIFRRGFNKNTSKDISTTEGLSAQKRCGLVVIGVHPSHRGRGFFESLMYAFEQQALSRDIHHLVLSVRSKNERAINAYKKSGWMISKQNDATVEMFKYL